ncbi:MAG TPA: hypothetical protein VE863_16675 [Pyrinomonadaceae bacterium]|nr:hypothetical protein [Pyrinomonadaceae bacterium]
MAIDTELSSEIATALLTGKEKSDHELNDLKETVIKVHSTLQELAADSRRRRIVAPASEKPDPRN